MPTPPDLPPKIVRLITWLRKKHPELEAASEYARDRRGAPGKAKNIWALFEELIKPKLAAGFGGREPLVRELVALAAWLGPEDAGPPPLVLCDGFLTSISDRPGTAHQALDYVLLGGAREAEAPCTDVPRACWGGRRPCGNARWDERWPHAIHWLAIVAEAGLRAVRKRLKNHVRGFGCDPHEHLDGDLLVSRQASRPGEWDREEAWNLTGDALEVAAEFTSKASEWRPGTKYEEYQDVRWWDPTKGNARKFLQWAYQGDDSTTGPLPSQSFIHGLYGRLLQRREEVEAGDFAFYICRSELCEGKRKEEMRAKQALALARKQEEAAKAEFADESIEAQEAKKKLVKAGEKAEEASKVAAQTQREFDGEVDEARPVCPSCGALSFWICMRNLLYVPGAYGGRKFRGCSAGKKRKKEKAGRPEWQHYFSDGMLQRAGFQLGGMRMNPRDESRIEQGQAVPEPDYQAPLPPACCPQHRQEDYCSQTPTWLMVQIRLAGAAEIPEVQGEIDNENE